MKIIMKQTQNILESEVEIRYLEVDDEITALIRYVENKNTSLIGEDDGKKHRIKQASIHYIESVDKKVFIYTEGRVYRSPLRLYQVAKQLNPDAFVQVNKCCVLNIDMLDSIQTLKNSQLEATLLSGEKILVSRTFTPALKKTLDIKRSE